MSYKLQISKYMLVIYLGFSVWFGQQESTRLRVQFESCCFGSAALNGQQWFDSVKPSQLRQYGSTGQQIRFGQWFGSSGFGSDSVSVSGDSVKPSQLGQQRSNRSTPGQHEGPGKVLSVAN
ncbi:hypothetical protein HanRHA438_Chr04g0173531 [Helianthus annuus]|uniref:Uncharacterized protein n=1 Tax=Helianthus annuus TaxID=4232 RepID=A0A9K3J7Q7_HELAN|nr:hypothetical protein HanXRQr2_Chr04g0163731 [Helianthus annuus]KAJ0926639.1 hypothetical protein HanRHA438_Chr04g0173531 [Helianthus annuus]